MDDEAGGLVENNDEDSNAERTNPHGYLSGGCSYQCL
jgi:hypothetical protein